MPVRTNAHHGKHDHGSTYKCSTYKYGSGLAIFFYSIYKVKK